MADIKKQLEEIGLSDKEAAVYLASLELGKSPVQKISQQAGIKRVTTYVVIESLMKKGLMSSAQEGKKTYFFAEDPGNLIRIVESQKNEISQKEKTVSGISKELKELFESSGKRPVVRFFYGVEGIRTIRDDYLKEHDRLRNDYARSVTPVDLLFKIYPKHTEEVTAKRTEKRIRSRVIYTNISGPIKGATSKKELREALYAPPKFSLPGDISVYGDKVILSSLKGRIVEVLIEDKNIAETVKKLFELAWEGAKNYKDNKD
mgnify:CR=1 FL=1